MLVLFPTYLTKQSVGSNWSSPTQAVTRKERAEQAALRTQTEQGQFQRELSLSQATALSSCLALLTRAAPEGKLLAGKDASSFASLGRIWADCF